VFSKLLDAPGLYCYTYGAATTFDGILYLVAPPAFGYDKLIFLLFLLDVIPDA